MSLFTSFVGLDAWQRTCNTYLRKTEPKNYESAELEIFHEVFSIIYPLQSWWAEGLGPKERAKFLDGLRRIQSEKYEVPEMQIVRNDYDFLNLRFELPRDAHPPTWGEWRCIFSVVDMRAATRNQVMQWIRIEDQDENVEWEFVPPKGWYRKFYDAVEYPHN